MVFDSIFDNDNKLVVKHGSINWTSKFFKQHLLDFVYENDIELPMLRHATIQFWTSYPGAEAHLEKCNWVLMIDSSMVYKKYFLECL